MDLYQGCIRSIVYIYQLLLWMIPQLCCQVKVFISLVKMRPKSEYFTADLFKIIMFGFFIYILQNF